MSAASGILDGGLVEIGLDSAEARRAAPYLLPTIPARFGRPCSPSSQLRISSHFAAAVSEYHL
jgi:hypothetical protein